MRKVMIIFLIVVIGAFVGGIFYLNNRQESETGYKDGLKMGYLYGFNDARAGSLLKTENLRERLFIEGKSTYDRAFLDGAKNGYVKGYAAGKE